MFLEQSLQSLFQITYNTITCTTANKWPSRETLAVPVSGTCISESKTWCGSLFSTTRSWQDTQSGKVSIGQHKIIHCTLLSAKLWHFPNLKCLNHGRQRRSPVTLPRAVIVEKSPVPSLTWRRRLKNNTTPVRHSDYMGQLSAKASSSRPDLMLWKFQPVYLRSTDFLSEKRKEWAEKALQRDGMMPGLLNGITASSGERLAEPHAAFPWSRWQSQSGSM